MEMTSNRIGDAPVLPALLAQIPTEERIGSVTADGIYDTKGCHGAIVARGAEAIIPPRRNARAWKGYDPELRSRNKALRTCVRFDLANWKKWSRISPTKSRGSQDDLAGLLEPVAFTCSTSNSSAHASWSETSTARTRKSRSASHS